MSWLVCIESLILIEQVIFREEPRVDIAVPEIEIRDALVVDVRQLFANPTSQDIAEDEQCAGSQQNATSCEGRMYTRFAIQHSAHMNAATTSDATHVVELW